MQRHEHNRSKPLALFVLLATITTKTNMKHIAKGREISFGGCRLCCFQAAGSYCQCCEWKICEMSRINGDE
jgi:hypothetical protein